MTLFCRNYGSPGQFLSSVNCPNQNRCAFGSCLVYMAPSVTHNSLVTRRRPAVRLGGCEDKKYSITYRTACPCLGVHGLGCGLLYSITVGAMHLVRAVNVLARPLRGTISRMVLLHDCDPSPLTRALSAGYNIIYIPIESVGVAYRETISRFRSTSYTRNRFLGPEGLSCPITQTQQFFLHLSGDTQKRLD
jgi:hypothetical protein